MEKTKLLLGWVVLISLSSCLTTKWVAPPYTSVDKIIKVKDGMTIEQTNSTLGIEPYDVYSLQDEGSSILIYHYRTKQRRMTVPQNIELKEKAIRGDERSQTEGEPWYDTDHHLIYVLFKDGTVSTLLTDQGRSDAEYLLLVDNNIKAITKKELTTFKEVLDTTQHAESLIIPLSDKWKKTKSGTSIITNQKESLKSLIK